MKLQAFFIICADFEYLCKVLCYSILTKIEIS